MSNDYQAVSCETHSKYQLAIIRGQQLRISWQPPTGSSITEILKPHDVITHQGAEYLLALDAHGVDKKIRLDKILEAYPENILD